MTRLHTWQARRRFRRMFRPSPLDVTIAEARAFGQVICGAGQEECRCAEEPGHEGLPHRCSCGGSWFENEAGEISRVVAWPGSASDWPGYP